jgi:glycosyltransferase involved in cell wall biosynthesis
MPQSRKISIIYEGIPLVECVDDPRQRRGIFYVAYNLLRELLRRPDVSVALRGINGSFFRTKYRRAIRALPGLEEVKFFDGNLTQVDALLSPRKSFPREWRTLSANQYVVVHDLIPLIRGEWWDSLFFEIIGNLSWQDQLLAVSEHTAKCIAQHLPHLDPGKITTIRLAADREIFAPCVDVEALGKVRRTYAIPSKRNYILCLCPGDVSGRSRKNLPFAAHNFLRFIAKHAIDDLVLVFAGRWTDAAGTDIDDFCQSLQPETAEFHRLRGKILRIGSVESKDLAALYGGALCSVYPSTYEGFGLPPLESMQCGCPTLASSATSLPEVVGDGGILFSPTDGQELIAAYERLYFDSNLRKELSIRGIERAKQFSWESCVDTILEKIRGDLKEKRKEVHILRNWRMSLCGRTLASWRRQGKSLSLRAFGLPLLDRVAL